MNRKGAAQSKRSVKYTFTGSDNSPKPSPQPMSAAVISPQPPIKAAHYDLLATAELPKPLADPCRVFLLAAFQPGEGVGIAQEVMSEESKKGIPKDGGVVLDREQWLEKLAKADGDPNKFMSTKERTGAFVRINPLAIDGKFAVRGIWKTTTKASNYPIFLWENDVIGSADDAGGAPRGMVNGYRALVTNQISSGAQGGNPGNGVIFGNWNDLVLASWAGVDFVLDPYSLKKSGQIEVCMTQWADVGIRHAPSFCTSTDSGAQ